MFVLDSHCDTPSQIYRLRDLRKDNERAHIDFPKLKRGGVDGAFFALYTSNSLPQERSETYARELLRDLRLCVEANSDVAAFATSRTQALANQAAGLFSVFVGLENGQPLGRSLDSVDWFYDMGVRYITLTHAGDNEICDSCTSKTGGRWHGLSPFGREVVARMNSLGMLVDVSHISDESFWDVLDCSTKPVVATHSCCRALADRPRNMSDAMIKALAEHGGVIQINFYPSFLDAEFARFFSDSGLSDWADTVEEKFIAHPYDKQFRDDWDAALARLESCERPSFKRIADHIDHAVEIAGVDHVGLGSDFDGIPVTPAGLEDVSCFGVIFEELRSRGYSEADIEKIAGGNFLRLL